MEDPWLLMGRLQKLYEKVRKALELKQERKKDELSCVWRLNLKLKERWRKQTFALVETLVETFALMGTVRLLKWDQE